MKTKLERVRGFQPPWRWVKVFTCDCGKETRLRVNWHPIDQPPRGAIACPHCGGQLYLGGQ